MALVGAFPERRLLEGDQRMKGIRALLCSAWLALACPGTIVAQDTNPANTNPAQEPKPAAITVLEDASPVMYGRSAKIKATVEAIDLDTRVITLKGPKGRLITLRVEERVRNLPQVQVGDEIVVRYHESVGLQLRRVEMGDSTGYEETGSADPETVQNRTPGAAKQYSVAAYVEAVSPREKTVTLRGPDGNLFDLYVRDLSVLETLTAGDNVVAMYTEAAAVSIELPKKKEKPKPKPRKKKQIGASTQ